MSFKFYLILYASFKQIKDSFVFRFYLCIRALDIALFIYNIYYFYSPDVAKKDR